MKRIFVQFGVNVGGLKEAMSEHVRNLFEADSAPDHLCCRRVPKRMRAQPADRDSSESEMALRDATYCAGASNRAERCTSAQKEERLGALGPAILHVPCKGLADITRQGQLSFPRGFRRMDSNLPCSPVDI